MPRARIECIAAAVFRPAKQESAVCSDSVALCRASFASSMNLALAPEAMQPQLFARLAVAGVSLSVFGLVAFITKNFAVLALAVPPIVILEFFLARTR
jgi:hypothetical protein